MDLKPTVKYLRMLNYWDHSSRINRARLVVFAPSKECLCLSQPQSSRAGWTLSPSALPLPL
jgi:hypothetical protein